MIKLAKLALLCGLVAVAAGCDDMKKALETKPVVGPKDKPDCCKPVEPTIKKVSLRVCGCDYCYCMPACDCG